MAGLLDRFFADGGGVWEFFADVNVGDFGTDSEGRDGHALDELVRVLMENVAVFEGPGFRLVRIADQINGFGIGGRNKPPFDPSGETRPAAAAQPASLDFAGNGRLLHANRLLQHGVPAIP